jgi:hypothetical protein
MKYVAASAILITTLAAATAFDGTRWWSYVQFLASDDLKGRDTGSEGHKKAVQYVAAQFERDGLKPAGEQGYIQPVKFISKSLDESKSSVILVKNGKETPIKLGDEAIIGTRVDPAASVEGDLVFVGYGLRIPEKNYDDFAGLQTKGKIAVTIAGVPTSIPGALASHFQSAAERAKTLKDLGFVGSLGLQNPHHMDIPWERVASNRSQPTMHLAAPGMYESEGLQLGLTWNPAKANMLFSGTGHTFNELVDLAEAGKPQPHFAMNARLKVKTAVKHTELESQNVAAIFPGSDPKLKDEYVVLSGHVDHVGDSGAAINGDHIFNGAMDDAAGTAVILDIAAHLKETGVKPKRSILLVVVTAEEKGLLGSKYFAAHPTVNGKSIVADVNCDMFLPLYPLKILTVYGLDESTLGDDLRTVAAAMGVKVQPDPAPIRNVFIRSDQYNFILKGVPSVMAAFGSEKGSKEDEIEKEWLKNRYHAPSDDLNQPVDKAAAGKYVEMMEKLLLRVANADRKPEWKPESFFKRYASN